MLVVILESRHPLLGAQLVELLGVLDRLLLLGAEAALVEKLEVVHDLMLIYLRRELQGLLLVHSSGVVLDRLRQIGCKHVVNSDCQLYGSEAFYDHLEIVLLRSRDCEHNLRDDGRHRLHDTQSQVHVTTCQVLGCNLLLLEPDE